MVATVQPGKAWSPTRNLRPSRRLIATCTSPSRGARSVSSSSRCLSSAQLALGPGQRQLACTVRSSAGWPAAGRARSSSALARASCSRGQRQLLLLVHAPREEVGRHRWPPPGPCPAGLLALDLHRLLGARRRSPLAISLASSLSARDHRQRACPPGVLGQAGGVELDHPVALLHQRARPRPASGWTASRWASAAPPGSPTSTASSSPVSGKRSSSGPAPHHQRRGGAGRRRRAPRAAAAPQASAQRARAATAPPGAAPPHARLRPAAAGGPSLTMRPSSRRITRGQRAARVRLVGDDARWCARPRAARGTAP